MAFERERVYQLPLLGIDPDTESNILLIRHSRSHLDVPEDVSTILSGPEDRRVIAYPAEREKHVRYAVLIAHRVVSEPNFFKDRFVRLGECWVEAALENWDRTLFPVERHHVFCMGKAAKELQEYLERTDVDPSELHLRMSGVRRDWIEWENNQSTIIPSLKVNAFTPCEIDPKTL